MTLNLRRLTIAGVLFTERFVLSFVFFCLAWHEINKIQNVWSVQMGSQTARFVGTTHHLSLFLLSCFTTLFLLVGRRAAAPPRTIKSVFVPLLAAFFSLCYFMVERLPLPFGVNLCPPTLQMPMTIASLVFLVIGPTLALWGLLYLGRSFGIFVSVRKVVLRGPYRWIRHPMYLGWTCSAIGIALSNFTAAYLLIIATHFLLMLYRARLEEIELSEFSAEYRDYMKRTGFLFPRFFSRPLPPESGSAIAPNSSLFDPGFS